MPVGDGAVTTAHPGWLHRGRVFVLVVFQDNKFAPVGFHVLDADQLARGRYAEPLPGRVRWRKLVLPKVLRILRRQAASGCKFNRSKSRSGDPPKIPCQIRSDLMPTVGTQNAWAANGTSSAVLEQMDFELLSSPSR